MQSKYSVIGLMSGSSLDGTDLLHVVFEVENNNWKFQTGAASCVEYDTDMLQRLKHARQLSGKDLWQLHTDLGRYFGKEVRNFINESGIEYLDFVASHGHTIFHYPGLHFTTQIGDGAALAAACGKKVICDFRSSDIANGGQGAPVVPVGEKYLFPDYKVFLNIGGIANISFHTHEGIKAYDCCVANQVLNFLAGKKGLEYDTDGATAASGKINQELLSILINLEFNKQEPPKSLDNSYTPSVIIPLLENSGISVEDNLATYTEFTAQVIADEITKFSAEKEKVLITGGGAFNKHLIAALSKKCKAEICIPDEKTVKFKEALVIAFMGVLRERKTANVLSSVTGAKSDTINGAIYE